MAYYKLIREKSLSASSNDSSKAVHGNLYLVRTSGLRERLIPICSTLENADYLVPALIYRVQVTRSPKFHRLLPCLLHKPLTGVTIILFCHFNNVLMVTKMAGASR